MRGIIQQSQQRAISQSEIQQLVGPFKPFNPSGKQRAPVNYLAGSSTNISYDIYYHVSHQDKLLFPFLKNYFDHPLRSYGMRESWPSPSPGQSRKAGPDSVDAGELVGSSTQLKPRSRAMSWATPTSTPSMTCCERVGPTVPELQDLHDTGKSQ